MFAAVGCALVASILAGCGSSAAGRRPAGSSGPGDVALRYAETLFAGDFAAAGRYVAPSSRGAFLILTDGLGSSSVKARNLAVGRTTVTGSAAVAILTGTVCSTAGKTSKSVQRCVTNTDPAGSSPIFEVDLMRQSGGRWLVVYRAPASASGGGSTGATGSTPAGGATGSP